MKKDISKTLAFRFENSFTKAVLLTIKMPYLPFLATLGYYSEMYKAMKKACACNCEERLIKGKHWFHTGKPNRTIFIFRNGASIDMPYDATKKDIKIILHHIEGIKMSLDSK